MLNQTMSKVELSAIERKILNHIQEDIPLAPKPFGILSKRLGIKETEFLERIKELKDKGVIRNFAAHINHHKLGFRSSLIAIKAPPEKIHDIAATIAGYREVTHCYQRENEYNLWVVFISQNGEKMRRFLQKLAKEIGRENILSLPTKRQFKLKTTIKL